MREDALDIPTSLFALHWRHNDHYGVSNHQPHGCLLSGLFRRRSKKTSKLCVTGLCVGNSPGPVNSPHKGPVTRKMFPFDDVIMGWDNIRKFSNVANGEMNGWSCNISTTGHTGRCLPGATSSPDHVTSGQEEAPLSLMCTLIIIRTAGQLLSLKTVDSWGIV